MKKTKKAVGISMLAAIAFVLMAVCRIPITDFLKYEPKDIAIAIGGFIYGPLSTIVISVVVSFVEMFTLSGTGFIGFVMNVISTSCFAFTAAYIYKNKHNLKGAVIGLITGSLLTIAVMLLWNCLITPLYMGVPREAVAKMLLPVFLPFNLLKCSLNTALTLLVYKPVVKALRGINIIEQSNKKSKSNIGIILASLLITATCILVILTYNKII